MLAPYPVRLRSNSSPPRPRPHNPDTSPRLPSSKHNAPISNASMPLPSSSPVPVPSSSSSPRIREESPPTVSRQKTRPVVPSPSQPRKMFRLKRPSSSSSALRPTYERDLLGPSLSSNRDEPVVPPRPPRNPARIATTRRPQSASGVTPSQAKRQAPLPQSRSPMRSFLPTDPLAFPLVASLFGDMYSLA